MSRNGAERTQKTMNPTNSYPVAGMLSGKKLGMVANEGQIAVIQTAASLPPVQHCTADQMKLRRIR